MDRSVLVYRGEGAGWRSVRSTVDSVQRLLSGPLKPFIKPLKVDTISTAELLDGHWTRHAAMLVMPGGADLPYCRHLNGRGNKIIKDFVSGGGSYLGLCAGAYYGCARVVFEPGTPLEVVGDRELAFFPGIARGCAFPGFDYQTEAGAIAAEVQFTVPQELSDLQQQLEPTAHQRSASNSTAPQEHTALTVYDYCNGGPFFTAQDGSPTVDNLPGVSLLAEYCQVPVGMPAAPHQQQNEQKQQQQDPPAGQQYARRAGAVRCSVGNGVAVLCGTHPELGPEWLDPCGESNAVQGPQPHEAAAPAAAAEVANASPPQSQQLQQQAKGQGSNCLQTLVQDAAPARTAAVASSSSSDGSGQQQQRQGMPVVCRDVALAAHAQQLRQELEAVQAGRDLFLCSLLFEALPQYRLDC